MKKHYNALSKYNKMKYTETELQSFEKERNKTAEKIKDKENNLIKTP